MYNNKLGQLPKHLARSENMFATNPSKRSLECGFSPQLLLTSYYNGAANHVDATAGQRQNINVRFNRWIPAMSRTTKLDLQIHSIRDEELRKRLGIESLSEILDRRRMNWLEKVAKIPATLDDNRLPRKLLGDWYFGGKRRQGGQSKTLRKSYLDLLRKLQFDTNDSALCGPNGTLRNILELICNEPVEFKT